MTGTAAEPGEFMSAVLPGGSLFAYATVEYDPHRDCYHATGVRRLGGVSARTVDIAGRVSSRARARALSEEWFDRLGIRRRGEPFPARVS